MLRDPMAKRACAAGADAGDRLSALPDGLLHAILSFLPARQLVQTTVLSRRWRDLWCSTPCISIDEREFEIGSGRNVAAKKWSKFENFTTNLLLFHSNAVSLDKFRLFAHEHNHRDVDKWIRRGIKYCPAVLDVSILKNYDLAFKLPPLGSSVFSLKRLHLYNVSLDRRFAELLCSGCSVLEGLELRCCCNYFQDITSTSLKNLLIDSCVHETHPVVITAPGLASLHLGIADPCYRDGISMYKTASLVKASIRIQSRKFFPEKNQRRLLGSLFSVTSLELCGFETTALLILETDEFPIFPNMRTLSLGECFLDKCDQNVKLEVLGTFLENAPCLEKLTMRCCMFDEDSEMEWDIKRKSINLQSHDQKTFQCEKLKLVEVIYKEDHDHRLVELLWGITRSLPDASITLTKI